MRLPVLLIVAGLAFPLAACGDQLSTSSAGTPPPLLLASTSRDALALAPGASGTSGWQLSGALPAGTPAPMRIEELSRGPVAPAVVTRLAAALGVGAPHRSGAGWVVGSKLSVRDDPGQPWTFGLDQPVCSPPVNGTVTCSTTATVTGTATVGPGGNAGMATVTGGAPSGSGASGSSGGTSTAPGSCASSAPDGTTGCVFPVPPARPQPTLIPSPAPSPLPAAEARAVAARVFAALGVTDSVSLVQVDGLGGVQVTVDPRVAGSATTGFSSTVTVGPDRRVRSGNGWLATTTEGPAYPLISARAAFDRLPLQPQPLGVAVDMPCRVNGPCQGPAPRVVTGATLGLSLQYRTDGRLTLVPSWLFRVQGADQPVAQVAVEPRFLGGPTPGPSTSPGNPTSIAPGPPSAAVTDPRVTSYRVSSDGRKLTVEFAHGVCPRASYSAAAKESDARVTVVVTPYDVASMDPNTACIDLAQVEHATVSLQAPLGKRTVLDEDGGAVRSG